MSTVSRFLALLVVFLWGGVAQGQGVCTPSDTVACVLGNQFQVEVTWQDEPGNPCALPRQPESGVGTVLTQTGDTAVFALPDPATADLFVKVLDGCSINGHVWVFAAAATDLGFSIVVTDTRTGASKTYVNPIGVPAPSITDTGAFADCPLKALSGVEALELTPSVTTKQGSCVPSATTLCLQDGRFQLEVTWQTATPTTGSGQVVPWQTESSGLFWFFAPTNWELLVKVIDGRPVNGHFWVMFAGTTNVGFTLTVTDTETGAVAEYVNPLGNPADAMIDRGGPCAAAANAPIPIVGPTGLTLLVLGVAGAGLLALRRGPRRGRTSVTTAV